MKVLPEPKIPRPAGGISPVALWALFLLTVRQHVHGRRWMVMAALFLLPAGLAVLVRATATNVPGLVVEFLMAFLFLPQALLPLIALVYASGIIQDEQEEQTLTYLLMRPIPRWAIYLVKMAATLVTTVALTVVFTLVTYAAVYVGGDTPAGTVVRRALTAAWIHGLAVAAYVGLFGLIGLYTKRAIVAGILYAAVVEGLLANLPFGLRLVTVIYYARLTAYRSLDFVVTERGRTEEVAATAWQLDVRDDPGLTAHPSLQTCVLVLGLASLGFALLGALYCARREFHVKTPEGG